MSKMSFPVLVTLAAAALTAHAQTNPPSKPLSCDAVPWKDARIAKSCVDVVDRNGKRYVKMSGKVTKKSEDSITVLLDGSKEELTWMPDLGETVLIDGKPTPPKDVDIGQPLRFYVPEAQVTTK
jgi:hypothetical protein